MPRISNPLKKAARDKKKQAVSKSTKEIIAYLRDGKKGLSLVQIADMLSCTFCTVISWIYTTTRSPDIALYTRLIEVHRILYNFKALPMQEIAVWWEKEFDGVSLKSVMKETTLSPLKAKKFLQNLLKTIERKD